MDQAKYRSCRFTRASLMLLKHKISFIVNFVAIILSLAIGKMLMLYNNSFLFYFCFTVVMVITFCHMNSFSKTDLNQLMKYFHYL